MYVPAAGDGEGDRLLRVAVGGSTDLRAVGVEHDRSRSAEASETLPMETSSDLAPAGTSTVVVWVSPFAMVGRAVLDEPSGPPASLPSKAAKLFVTFQEAAVGGADLRLGHGHVLRVEGRAETVASSVYGLSSSGEVRRDSTSISQTPACGFW